MLKAGFYETEITPPLGCCIPGYYTKREADGVKDKLYFKALAVSDGKATVVISAIDACYISKEVHDSILERASSYTGISTDNMSISSIHTHTGIPSDYMKGPTTIEDAEYNKYLGRIGGDCITLAVQNMEEVKVKFGTGYVDSIAFNRIYNMADGRLQTAPEIGDKNVVSPSGPIDPEVSVLYIEDLKGNPKGAIINYACHADVVKGTKYSGDWPSILSYRLKDEYGRDFVSLFLNGTSGNINHVDVINDKEYPPSEHYIKMGNIVAKEAIKAIESSDEISGEIVAVKKEYLKMPEGDWNMKSIEWAKKIVATVKPIEGLTLGMGTGHKEQEDLIYAKSLLAAYDYRSEYRMVGVQAIKIGDVYIYTMPGEPFVEFGLYIKENSPSRKNIVSELSHAYTGYLPLKHMIGITIYESSRTSLFLQPDAGEILTKKAVEFAKEIAY